MRAGGVVVLEELSRASGSFGLLVEALGVLFAHTLNRFGAGGDQMKALEEVARGGTRWAPSP